jgi:hypothetical protein
MFVYLYTGTGEERTSFAPAIFQLFSSALGTALFFSRS